MGLFPWLRRWLALLGIGEPPDRALFTVKLPAREPYHATAEQEARYQRVMPELQRRKLPINHPMYVDEVAGVTLREPAEVARRAIILYAVAFRADGGNRERPVEILNRWDLWSRVTPRERELLEAEKMNSGLAHRLLWRTESLWVLVWALRSIDEMPWPAGCCDVPRLVSVVNFCVDDPDFVERARLRSTAEILDALQTTLMIHSAIRGARSERRNVPADLDWSSGATMTPVETIQGVSTVEERHHALNWLLGRFCDDADYDGVDTPTVGCYYRESGRQYGLS